jgi:hypothetical protein
MTAREPSAPAQYIVLHGRHTTLLLEASADEAPVWRYWGPRLPEGSTPGMPLRETRALPSFTLDADPPLTLAPTFGVGWFGDSALLAHRDGLDFAQAFTRCALEWIEPRRRVKVHLADAVASLRLSVSLALDEHDVLVVTSELTNTGPSVLDVQWLAAGTLLLPGHADTVRSYAGQHLHEFLLQVQPLSRALWQRENQRGRTSHDCFPGAVVTTPAPPPMRASSTARIWPGRATTSRPSSGCPTVNTSGNWANGWRPAKAGSHRARRSSRPRSSPVVPQQGSTGWPASFTPNCARAWPGPAARCGRGRCT